VRDGLIAPQQRAVGPGRRRSDSGLETDSEIGDVCRMSTVKQIESALERLPLEELQAVRDWLDDFIEDQLEVSDEFKAKIQRAKAEIAEGVYSRVRKTETGQ
jgi:hypothetical protein